MKNRSMSRTHTIAISSHVLFTAYTRIHRLYTDISPIGMPNWCPRRMWQPLSIGYVCLSFLCYVSVSPSFRWLELCCFPSFPPPAVGTSNTYYAFICGMYMCVRWCVFILNIGCFASISLFLFLVVLLILRCISFRLFFQLILLNKHIRMKSYLLLKKRNNSLAAKRWLWWVQEESNGRTETGGTKYHRRWGEKNKLLSFSNKSHLNRIKGRKKMERNRKEVDNVAAREWMNARWHYHASQYKR